MTGVKDLDDRLYKFALRIVEFVRTLPNEIVGYELGRQVLRSGTSIAANYEEASGAYSKDDFIYKMNLAFKEARETYLWLRIIKDSELTKGDRISYLVKESKEIRNILGKSVSTARKKRNKQNSS
jgi:four helix bundle protein